MAWTKAAMPSTTLPQLARIRRDLSIYPKLDSPASDLVESVWTVEVVEGLVKPGSSGPGVSPPLPK